MAVKLRLSRIGKKHVPFFRIIAIDSRKKRDGAYIENLGTFDLLKGSFVQFHEERINDWIEKGAIVTEPVKKLHRLYKDKDKASAPATGAKKAKVTPVKESKKEAAKEASQDAK